jgi:lipid-binding SYLF domain-containing protein
MTVFIKPLVFTTMLVMASGALHASSLFDKAKDLGSAAVDKGKEVGSTAVDIVDETATSTGKVISGEQESPEVIRAEIDQMEAGTLQRLFAQSPEARERFDTTPAYAVFDSRKMSFLITTAFGSGVAVNKETGKRVYMKMAEGGVNYGAGAQLYQVIFLFPSQVNYRDFVNKGWDAGAGADAVAGKDDGNLGLRLPDGTSVYKLNEKGIALNATLTGTKYWKWDELNR